MVKKIVKYICLTASLLSLAGSISLSANAASSLYYTGNLTGKVTTGIIKNTSDGKRYYSNSVCGTSTKNSTSGGTVLESSVGTLGANKSNSVSANVGGYPHAYGKGFIYNSSTYESGVAASSGVIFK